VKSQKKKLISRGEENSINGMTLKYGNSSDLSTNYETYPDNSNRITKQKRLAVSE